MKKNELQDKVLDQVLKYVAEKRMEEMPEELPPDEWIEREITFRPEFEKRMNALFTKQRKKAKALRIRRVSLRAGIAAAIVLAVLATVVFSVDAFRVPVLNFFHSDGQQSTTIHVDEKANYNAFAEKIKGLYLPEYIPETYTASSITKLDTIYVAVYENPKGDSIRLKKLNEGDAIGVDNENAHIESITVNGEPAQYYEKNESNTLIFKYKHTAFSLNGSIAKEDLIRIAESMEYKQ